MLISFWQKSSQNWQNGGHFKKNQFLNLNLKFKAQKPLEIERNGCKYGITCIISVHRTTFFKISKMSKFYVLLSFVLLSFVLYCWVLYCWVSYGWVSYCRVLFCIAEFCIAVFFIAVFFIAEFFISELCIAELCIAEFCLRIQS